MAQSSVPVKNAGGGADQKGSVSVQKVTMWSNDQHDQPIIDEKVDENGLPTEVYTWD